MPMIVSTVFLSLLLTFFALAFDRKREQEESQENNKPKSTLKPLVSEKWHNLFKISELGARKKTHETNDLSPQVQENDKEAITLILKPLKGQFFAGKQLKQAFAQAGLIAGSDGFMYKTQGIKTLYSVCHLYQPGTFSFHQLEHTSYSGCLFILCLEESPQNLKIFELMLEDFQRMGRFLHAQCLDENAEPLSLSNIHFIREQILKRKN